jgi:ABC-type uncharacterized transport system ATPase subunit
MTTDVAGLTEDLTKFYGAHRGIEGLDLEVGAGEVMDFLGPNRAGKTPPPSACCSISSGPPEAGPLSWPGPTSRQSGPAPAGRLPARARSV